MRYGTMKTAEEKEKLNYVAIGLLSVSLVGSVVGAVLTRSPLFIATAVISGGALASSIIMAIKGDFKSDYDILAETIKSGEQQELSEEKAATKKQIKTFNGVTAQQVVESYTNEEFTEEVQKQLCQAHCDYCNERIATLNEKSTNEEISKVEEELKVLRKDFKDAMIAKISLINKENQAIQEKQAKIDKLKQTYGTSNKNNNGAEMGD